MKRGNCDMYMMMMSTRRLLIFDDVKRKRAHCRWFNVFNMLRD